MHCGVLEGGGGQFATDTLEELAFSVCRAKDGGSRFLQNISTCIETTQLHTPEESALLLHLSENYFHTVVACSLIVLL